MYIGIIYNRKGLCERNYLYTLEEMTKLDHKTLTRAVEADGMIVDGPAFASDKTSVALLLKDDVATRLFLFGRWNGPDTADPDWRIDKQWDDWTWNNDTDNDLYFVGHSSTMETVLAKYGIPAFPENPRICGPVSPLLELGMEGFSCAECGEQLHATDHVAICPDCGAVFCKNCVADGSFAEHCRSCNGEEGAVL